MKEAEIPRRDWSSSQAGDGPLIHRTLARARVG